MTAFPAFSQDGFRKNGASARPSAPAPARVQTGVAALPSAITRAGFIVWVPFWLAMGIGLWFQLKWEPGALHYGSVAVAGLSACLLRQRLIRQGAQRKEVPRSADFAAAALLSLTILLAGFLLAGLRSHLVAAPVLDFRYYGTVEGTVVDIDRSTRDRVRITLNEVRLSGVEAGRTPKKVRVSLFDESHVPIPGEVVMLTAHLGPPPGPSKPDAFDFRRMAWFESLGAIGYARTPVMTLAPPESGGRLAILRFRMLLSGIITSQIAGQPGAVASALITGDRSGISEETNEVMRIANLYHIISISGLHMSMLAALVYGAVRFGGVGLMMIGLPSHLSIHKIAAVAAIAASAFYLMLSGGGVATERSFLMLTVMLGAILFDRRAMSLRTIAVAAIIVLALAPETLTSASFQMSFGATIGLVLAYREWPRIAAHIPVILHPVALLIATSLVAGLVTGPIAAAQFGRIAPYGMLANLLAVPLVGLVVMPMGLLAMLLAPVGLEALPLWVMGKGTEGMLRIAEWVAGLGGADLVVPLPPPWVLPLLCAAAFVLMLLRRGGTRVTGALRLLALTALIGACLGWSIAPRPAVLISGEGAAIGLLTANGRALSKSGGGAFSAETWLTGDGDPATIEDAAGREGWTGPRQARRASFGTADLLHLTGARGFAMLPDLCRKGAIIVTDQRATGKHGDCVLLDQIRLRTLGSVALTQSAAGWKMITTKAVAGQRSWTASARKTSSGRQRSKKKDQP